MGYVYSMTIHSSLLRGFQLSRSALRSNSTLDCNNYPFFIPIAVSTGLINVQFVVHCHNFRLTAAAAVHSHICTLSYETLLLLFLNEYSVDLIMRKK